MKRRELHLLATGVGLAFVCRWLASVLLFKLTGSQPRDEYDFSVAANGWADWVDVLWAPVMLALMVVFVAVGKAMRSSARKAHEAWRQP